MCTSKHKVVKNDTLTHPVSLPCGTHLSLVRDVFVDHVMKSSVSFKQLNRTEQFIQRRFHSHPQVWHNTVIKQVTYLAKPSQLLGPSDIHWKKKTPIIINLSMEGMRLQHTTLNLMINQTNVNYNIIQCTLKHRFTECFQLLLYV